MWGRTPLQRALGATAVVGAGAAVIGDLRVSGPLYPYLTTWQVAVLFVGLLAVVVWAVSRAPVPAARAAVGGLLLLAGVLTVALSDSAARFPILDPVPAVSTASRAVLPQVAGSRRVHVVIRDAAAWPFAAGMAAELERHGIAVVVDDDWVPLFGASRALRAPTPVTVSIDVPGQPHAQGKAVGGLIVEVQTGLR